MSQKKGTIDGAMLLSAEAAVEAAAESVARFGMDVDDFATLAKAKLLESKSCQHDAHIHGPLTKRL